MGQVTRSIVYKVFRGARFVGGGISMNKSCHPQHLHNKIKFSLSPAREIHNLDPQPHRHCMLAPRASAPQVTRCSLGKYWSRDFFQKEAESSRQGVGNPEPYLFSLPLSRSDRLPRR